MADDSVTVASAVVVVPDAEPTHPVSPLSNKRRSSNIPLEDEQEATKRPRLSDDTSTSNPTATSPPPPVQSSDNSARDKEPHQRDRRRAGQAEERKRGKRLFGALLGTLSQSTASPSLRRRVDIEKKIAEKRKIDEARRDSDSHVRYEPAQEQKELDEVMRDRRDRLMNIRRREQWRVLDEEMKVKNESLLNRARFLKTSAEPVLYYKPWQLLPEQEDVIQKQIEEAEENARIEEAQFQHKRDTALAEEETKERGQNGTTAASVPEELDEATSTEPLPQTAEPDTDGQVSKPRDVSTDPNRNQSSKLGSAIPKATRAESDEVPDAAADQSMPDADITDAASGKGLSEGLGAEVGPGGEEEAAAADLNQDQDQNHGEEMVEGDEDTVIY